MTAIVNRIVANAVTETDTPAAFSAALHAYQVRFLDVFGLATRTCREYTTDVGGLVTFLSEQIGLTRPAQVSRQHLTAYLAELRRRRFTTNTCRRKVAAIRSFFAFLEAHGAVTVNPAYRLLPPERDHHLPRVLSASECRKLAAACAGDPRAAAIIALLLDAGLRLSELACIRLGDMTLPQLGEESSSFAPGRLRVHGRGARARTVVLSERAANAVSAYLTARPPVATPRLLVTRFRRPMGPRAIQYLVDRYLSAAGITGASVHTLRHTCAARLVAQGLDLRDVQEALGHASLKTTSLYVHLAHELVDAELQANAPCASVPPTARATAPASAPAR